MVQVSIYLVVGVLTFCLTQVKAQVPLPPMPVMQEMAPRATATVHFVLSAKNLPDTETLAFDHPDGYVEAIYYRSVGSPPSETEQTEVVDNDHNPEWNTTFEVKYLEGQKQKFHFKIMDDDYGMDDVIGHVEVSLKEIVDAPHCRLSLPIIPSNIKYSKSDTKLVIDCMIDRKVTDETVLRLRHKHRVHTFVTRFEIDSSSGR